MQRILRFYKEHSGWYIDLPEWTGSQADLQMVSGADTMLDFMSQGENDIQVVIDENPFERSNLLTFVRDAKELGNGAYYLLPNYNGIDINLEVWLCDVTKFVFGYFPEKIYLSALTN